MAIRQLEDSADGGFSTDRVQVLGVDVLLAGIALSDDQQRKIPVGCLLNRTDRGVPRDIETDADLRIHNGIDQRQHREPQRIPVRSQMSLTGARHSSSETSLYVDPWQPACPSDLGQN